jgi:N-acetylmuramoyl-L-alanine amidase
VKAIAQPPIITTNCWGARPAKAPPVYVGQPDTIVFHHTASHHAEIPNPRDESHKEAIRYARAIQRFHMDSNGWNDSGHNFLVCRNGLILVGRHMSLPAVRAGHMVRSAHCPGQNDQPGIEHEHAGQERMTREQFHSSVRLHAWIIERCRMAGARVILPHRRFNATTCPGSLVAELPRLRVAVDTLLGNP